MILKAHIENFRKMTFFDQEIPLGGITLLGENGEGKSSILDAIYFALAGKSGSIPLTKGEKKGVVELELKDGTKVSRRFRVNRNNENEVTTELRVTSPDGELVRRPQEYLNNLLGSAIVDPTKIINMKGKERVDTLKVALGLDFSKLDDERGRLFESRAEAKRRGILLEGQQKNYSHLPSEIKPGRDKDQILKDLNKIETEFEKERQANQLKKESQERYDNLTREIADRSKILKQFEEKQKEFERQLRIIEEGLKALDGKTKDINSEVDKLMGYRAEVENELKQGFIVSRDDRDRHKALKQELEDEMLKGKQAEEINFRQKLKDDYAKEQELVESITEKIHDIDDEKKKILAETKFPLEGMAFDGDDVVYNGIPFLQCSTAEKIRICVALNSLNNSNCKIMHIRDGALLDEESREIVKELAESQGFQIWIEEVDKKSSSGEGVLIIKDGRVND